MQRISTILAFLYNPGESLGRYGLLLILNILLFRGEAGAQSVQGTWTGTLRLHEKANTITGWSEKTITVSIKDNVGTGTIRYEDEMIIEGKSMGKGNCQGDGAVELVTVLLNPYDSTYEIGTIGPTCSEGSNPWSYGHGNGITILNHKFTNSSVLAGTESNTVQLPLDMGTVATTITWYLSTTPANDAELIVTPQNYNTWLPEPGRNELTPGSVMNIDLKLRGKNGRPLTKKARSFVLTLHNTSREKGIALNAPKDPSADQYPDFSFLVAGSNPSSDELQEITIPAQNGITGQARLASYDGGGWTTLVVSATLTDGTTVKGNLLVSGGITDIPIPKRDPGTQIAKAWLDANGNPGEMDDNETSRGNNYNGDGFTAYEEYRGFISEGRFLRLNPQRKELALRVKVVDRAAFAEGLSWFETGSDVKITRFHINEVANDRRINFNSGHAHDYDQYALSLTKGNLPGATVGQVYTPSPGPDIPKRTDAVVIDINKHYLLFPQIQNSYGQLLYTVEEMIANTVAHELGHGVSIWHHGDLPDEPSPQAVYANHAFPVYIYDVLGNEIFTRPYTIRGNIGKTGSMESGDLSCILAYNPYFNWSRKDNNGAAFFYRVPVFSMGRKICSSKTGTGINAPPLRGVNNYFGNATVGNCLSQIKLRE